MRKLVSVALLSMSSFSAFAGTLDCTAENKDVISGLVDDQGNVSEVVVQFADGSEAPIMKQLRPFIWLDEAAKFPDFQYKLVIHRELKLATLFGADANGEIVSNVLYTCSVN